MLHSRPKVLVAGSGKPAAALSRFLQLLKGRSSRHWRREFPQLQRLPTLRTRS